MQLVDQKLSLSCKWLIFFITSQIKWVSQIYHSYREEITTFLNNLLHGWSMPAIWLNSGKMIFCTYELNLLIKSMIKLSFLYILNDVLYSVIDFMTRSNFELWRITLLPISVCSVLTNDTWKWNQIENIPFLPANLQHSVAHCCFQAWLKSHLYHSHTCMIMKKESLSVSLKILLL